MCVQWKRKAEGERGELPALGFTCLCVQVCLHGENKKNIQVTAGGSLARACVHVNELMLQCM